MSSGVPRPTGIRSPDRRRFNAALGSWFAHHGRSFPWRRTRDPYRVFVAETLLRKTRAEDALPVYSSIVQRYPTVQALSRAGCRQLRCLVAPVGLPSRADTMLEATRRIATLNGGRMPGTRLDLLRLPGVGPYIASAIASFAHDERTPVVDNGVARVLARAFSLEPSRPAYLDSEVQSIAEQLLPVGGARRHNLALLDLSAAVCRASSPSCTSCPVRRVCMSCASNRAACPSRRLPQAAGGSPG